MKTISKLLAILLTLAMLFSLAACGGTAANTDASTTVGSESETEQNPSEDTEATQATEPTDEETVPEELLGEWKHEVDFDKLLEAMRNEGVDESELAFGEKLYSGLTDTTITVVLKDDGTFTLAFDEESAEKLVENMKEVLPDMLAALGGMTREEYEASLAETGMTLDDVFAQMDLDAESIFGAVSDGTYTYEDGKLTLISEDGSEVSYTVELVEDELHVVAFEDDSIPAELLPVVFVR